MTRAEEYIARWQQAGLLDSATAARLREHETAHTDHDHSGMRWQIMLSLALGAVLLLAGIALFAAARWDRVSPAQRCAIVVLVVALIHAAAVAARSRYSRLATALHALGTGATGVAVFTVGHIFHLNEPWPAGVFVWLLAAIAGWAILRDELQQTWTLLLLPAWAFGEFGVHTENFAGTELMLTRAIFMLGVSYLLVLMRSDRAIVRDVLISVGIVLTAVGTVALQAFDNLFRNWTETQVMPSGFQLLGWALVIAAPLATLVVVKARLSVAVLLAAFLAAALALPRMHTLHEHTNASAGPAIAAATPWAINYFIVAALAALLAFAGTRERQPYLVNFGIIGFGLTLLWFYFSDVMDKLDRSLSLIVLGLLFVAGGWALERFRRRVVRGLAARLETDAVSMR